MSLPVVKTWVTSTVNREVAGSSPAAGGKSRQRSSVAERHTRSLVPRQKNWHGRICPQNSGFAPVRKKEYVRLLEKYPDRPERVRLGRATADDHRRRERLVEGRAGKTLVLGCRPDHDEDHGKGR